MASETCANIHGWIVAMPKGTRNEKQFLRVHGKSNKGIEPIDVPAPIVPGPAELVSPSSLKDVETTMLWVGYYLRPKANAASATKISTAATGRRGVSTLSAASNLPDLHNFDVFRIVTPGDGAGTRNAVVRVLVGQATNGLYETRAADQSGVFWFPERRDDTKTKWDRSMDWVRKVKGYLNQVVPEPPRAQKSLKRKASDDLKGDLKRLSTVFRSSKNNIDTLKEIRDVTSAGIEKSGRRNSYIYALLCDGRGLTSDQTVKAVADVETFWPVLRGVYTVTKLQSIMNELASQDVLIPFQQIFAFLVRYKNERIIRKRADITVDVIRQELVEEAGGNDMNFDATRAVLANEETRFGGGTDAAEDDEGEGLV